MRRSAMARMRKINSVAGRPKTRWLTIVADRRGGDAGNRENGKAFELAIADPPFHPVDLRTAGADRPFRPLRDRRLQARPDGPQAVGRLRIAGEKPAVCADERVKLAWAAPDQRVELLEILRQNRDGDHAVEGTVSGRASARKHEKRCAKPRAARLHDLADITADVASDMRAEEAALAGAHVGRHLHELAGDEPLAVAVDEKDRAQLRQRIDDAFDALVQARIASSVIPRTISLTSAMARSTV